MILVNRVGDSITGSYNGKPFGVAFDEGKYAAMKGLESKANQIESMEELQVVLDEFEPLTKESYKELVETACHFILVNKATNKFYLKTAHVTSSKALPKAFVDRILTSVDKKIDVLPLVKCWVRFLKNPNYTDAKAKRFANYINKTYTNQERVAELLKDGLSHEVANERATTTQVAITHEGLLVCYKVSNEIDYKWQLDADGNSVKKPRYSPSIDDITGVITYDVPKHVEERIFTPAVMGDRGDEFYCGENLGHIIKVGQLHYLPKWEQVDCNDNQSCCPGLHCGGLDYIRGYQHAGTLTHNIFVDPMHIGAITDDGSGAMRVKQYFVHSSFAGVNRSIYHSSKYAELTDSEFLQMLDEAIKATGVMTEELKRELEEKHALAQ